MNETTIVGEYSLIINRSLCRKQMAAVAPLKSYLRRPALRAAAHSGPIGLAATLSFRNSQVKKWGSICTTYGERLPAIRLEERRRVRCTAEGMERGLFVGRKEEGGFVAAERLKVVALVAAVMCLCNADRVVMAVAIVPLAAKYGWSTAFLGIVQVTLSFYFISSIFYIFKLLRD